MPTCLDCKNFRTKIPVIAGTGKLVFLEKMAAWCRKEYFIREKIENNRIFVDWQRYFRKDGSLRRCPEALSKAGKCEDFDSMID